MLVVISNGLRAAAAWNVYTTLATPTTTIRCISSLQSYIQQSGRSVKSMNAKNTKKITVLENADANITCNFGDGDISRSRSRLPQTHAATHMASSIIVRWSYLKFASAGLISKIIMIIGYRTTENISGESGNWANSHPDILGCSKCRLLFTIDTLSHSTSLNDQGHLVVKQ